MGSAQTRWCSATLCLMAAAGCGGGGGGGDVGVDQLPCGDGVMQTGETCDDGAMNSDAAANACRTTCLVAACGDGVVDTGEDCDDGAANSDTAPDACRTDCDGAKCGDEVIDDGEACDDGNDNSETEADACRETCEEASCGDGVADTGEECDDGDKVEVNACANDCTSPAIWTQSVVGSFGMGIAVDSAGNVLVAGDAFGASTYDGWVRKYDASGATMWTQTYNGAANLYDIARGVAVDSSGNVVAVGTEEKVAAGDVSLWVRKYDGAGGTQWTQTHSTASGSALAFRVAVDAAGNVLVVGTEATPAAGLDMWVRKYDPSGGTLWTRTYGGAAGGDDVLRGVAVNAAGDVLVAGFEATATSADAWMRSYDPDGNILWTSTYPNAVATGIAVDSTGNVVVTGNVASSDIFVRKYDPAGAPIWTELYAGAANDFDAADDIAVDAAGNILVTGNSVVTTGDEPDIWTGKYDPAGALLWTRTYDGAAKIYDEGTGVRADASGNVLVVGFEGTGMDIDIWLTKYEP